MSSLSEQFDTAFQVGITTRVSSEWPELEGLASLALPDWRELSEPGSSSPRKYLLSDSPNLLDLSRTIEALDPAQLEENHFYALRLVSAKLGESLSVLETRKKVIGLGSSIIVAASLKKDSGLGFSSEPINQSMRQPIREAWNGLPEQARLINLLLFSARSRARGLQLPGRQQQWRIKHRAEEDLTRIGEEDEKLFLQRLTKTSLAGTQRICTDALQLDDSYRETGMPSLAMRARLRHASLGQVARRAAAIHQKIFNNSENLVRLEGSGFAFVPQASHEKARINKVLRQHDRTKVLVCPASRASTTIETIVGMAVDMIDKSCVQLGEPEVTVGRVYDYERDG